MSDLTASNLLPPALVYVSSRRYIYLGQTQLRIRDFHSGASSLLVCLDGLVKFRMPGEVRWISAKSILIPAGSRVAIDNQGAVISACYLDAAKPDFLLLKKQMRSISSGVYYSHAYEERLIKSLCELRDDRPSFADAQLRMESILYSFSESYSIKSDARVAYVVERLRNTAALNISVKTLADEVGLSESGLIRLFALYVGAPLRKHRLWYRLIDFVVLSLSGMPTATAIKASGFTDAAHLSRCYSGFFGVNFSYAFSKNTNVTYFFDEASVHNLPRAN